MLVVGCGGSPEQEPTPGQWATAQSTDTGVDMVSSLTVSYDPPGGLFTAPFELTLTGGSGAPVRYSVDGTDPALGPVYEGPIPIAGSAVVRAVAMVNGSPGPATSTAFVALSPATSLDSNLPIVVIDTLGRDLPSSWSPTLSEGAAVFIDTTDGRADLADEPAHVGAVGVRERGQSTTQYPKDSMKLETWDAYSNDRDVELLGMPSESDWVLQAPYADKTLMRNHLIYGWSNDIGRYASRTRFVEVYLATDGDGVDAQDYVGVYVLMEQIKVGDDRVDIAGLDPGDLGEPEISGGYLLKRDWLDGEDFFTTAHYHDSLIYVDPDGEDLLPAQMQWIRNYVDAFETAVSGPDFAGPDGYAAYIDVDAFIDHHILVELGRNVDGYVLSTYLHKDREGLLAMGPIWDYNGALGNGDYFEAWHTDGWHYENPSFPADNPNGYHSYARLFDDPAFLTRYHDRWFELRDGPLATEALTGDVDATAELLAEAQQRNFERWDILDTYVWPNAYWGGSYDDQVAYLRDWVRLRAKWMDQAIAEQYGP